ncbi:MAG: hypothetical protein ACLFUV_00860 [Methanomassiliicoccales archaeon]
MYKESSKALREVGAKTILSVGAAILIWIFGQLVFLPIAEGFSEEFLGYPVHSIVSFIIIIALAFIIFSVFVYVKRLSDASAGVMAYHFGKASGEKRVDSYKNYQNAISGILYVIVVVLAYLLFANYLAEIHAALPAILLLLIVIWSIFALWKSFVAISQEIGRYTKRWADDMEKKS